jgi:hypothetical protein
MKPPSRARHGARASRSLMAQSQGARASRSQDAAETGQGAQASRSPGAAETPKGARASRPPKAQSQGARASRSQDAAETAALPVQSHSTRPSQTRNELPTCSHTVPARSAGCPRPPCNLYRDKIVEGSSIPGVVRQAAIAAARGHTHIPTCFGSIPTTWADLTKSPHYKRRGNTTIMHARSIRRQLPEPGARDESRT